MWLATETTDNKGYYLYYACQLNINATCYANCNNTDSASMYIWDKLANGNFTLTIGSYQQVMLSKAKVVGEKGHKKEIKAARKCGKCVLARLKLHAKNFEETDEVLWNEFVGTWMEQHPLKDSKQQAEGL